MPDGLTSESVNTFQPALKGTAETKKPWLIPAILAFGFIATLGLWWRFGEDVFLTSMMNAVLACF